MISRFRKLKSIPILPYLPVVLLPVILLSRFLFQGETFYWGISGLQFIPWRAYAFSWLSQGVIPFWNSFNGMGAPLAANYQLALFYPPTWILYIFYLLGGTTWMAWAHQVVIVIHLVWAGIGMIVLMRNLGAGRLAQFVAGVCFPLGGYLTGRLGFYSMVWAAAWLPWLLVAAARIAAPVPQQEFSGRKPGLLPITLCTTMMLLAGHAQLSWYILILVYVWVLVGGWFQNGLRGSIRASIRLTGPILLGAVLAAIQLVPTGEYLLQSQRSGSVDFETMMAYSYWPWRLITLLAPDFFGNPGLGNYWGYGNYWEDALYMGVLPFFLSLSTIPILFNRMKAEGNFPGEQNLVRLLWVIVLGGILFGMGRNTPVFPFLARYIPTFDMFHGPARFLIWTSFGLSVLAGIGANRWKPPQGRRLYWMRLGTAGGFALTLGALLAWFFLREVNPTFIRATALAGIWAVGAGLLTLFIQPVENNTRYRLWLSLTVMWISLDVVSAAWLLNPGVPLNFYSERSPELAEKLNGHRYYLPDALDYRLKYDRFIRFEDFRPLEDIQHERDVELPNLNLLDGIASVNNFDPLEPEWYSSWMKTLDTAPEDQRDRLLALMDVGITQQLDPNHPLGIIWKPIPAASRLRWFHCVIPISEEQEAFRAVFEASKAVDFPNPSSPLVIDGNPEDPALRCEQPESAKMTLTDEIPGRTAIDVSTAESGWLFLADTWYPGWKVRIDGQSGRLYRADGAFMAVQVPPGHHRIEFYYQPDIYRIGLLTSVAGWIFIIYSIIISRIILQKWGGNSSSSLKENTKTDSKTGDIHGNPDC